MTEQKIEFTFPGPYDQVELEGLLYEAMCERAKDIQYAVDNPWGEFLVAMGDTVMAVQWQYAGLEPEDFVEDDKGEWQPVGDWYWEYDGPDFEVSCAWKVK